MRLLLDTHFLIWMIRTPDRIMRDERRAMSEAGTLYVSSLSLWEIRLKWNARDRNGNRKGDVDPVHALGFAQASELVLETLSTDDVIRPLDPPLTHRDPFDEMLLVHAGGLRARLLTRDARLRTHPLAYPL